MKKNILFIFPDQHRGDWLPYNEKDFKKMGIDSLPVQMPNLRSLMDNGMTFTRAVSSSPLCVPARACLASGKRYDRCQVYNNDFNYPLSQKTFYSTLKDVGYNVCGVGKLDLHKPILYWGKDGWIDQLDTLGFTDAIDSEGKYDLVWSSFYEPKGPYSDFLQKKGLLKEHCKDYVKRHLDSNDTRATTLPEDAYGDNWIADNGLKMLDVLQNDEKPWFLMVNFTGPHNPWDITEDMKEKWKDVQFPESVNSTLDKDEVNKVRQNYAAMLENIDDNIGRFVSRLKESGEFENTVIIYSSDHGEMLGDNSRYLKSIPDRASIHIPMVISGPGIVKGVSTDALVELQDLTQTIVELGESHMPEALDSMSMKDLLSGQVKKHRKYQTSALDTLVQPSGDDCADYSEFVEHKKRAGDKELINEFNTYFGFETAPVNMDKMKKKNKWKTIVTERYKLVSYQGKEHQLFDVLDDPWELNDIAIGNEHLIAGLIEMAK